VGRWWAQPQLRHLAWECSRGSRLPTLAACVCNSWHCRRGHPHGATCNNRVFCEERTPEQAVAWALECRCARAHVCHAYACLLRHEGVAGALPGHSPPPFAAALKGGLMLSVVSQQVHSQGWCRLAAGAVYSRGGMYIRVWQRGRGTLHLQGPAHLALVWPGEETCGWLPVVGGCSHLPHNATPCGGSRKACTSSCTCIQGAGCALT
jgi:hypothetical protein